jgi:protein ImuB
MRVAVAATQTAAMLIAIARPGLTVAAGEVSAAVAELPVAALQQLVDDAGSGMPPGLRAAARAKATAARLDTFQRWGLKTLGEVAALPAADLSERMGQGGLALHRLARGLDDGPLVPDPDVPRFVQAIELEWPIDALEPLSFVFARLLDPLSAALERADRGAAALRLDLRLVNRTTHARVVQLPAAMRDARVLRTLLLLDLESHPPAAAIDVVCIEIDPAPSRITQYSLLERAIPSPETLATLTARLGALVGDGRYGSPALVDTHRPDGCEMRRFSPQHPGCGFRVPGPGTKNPEPGTRDPEPRTRTPDPGPRTPDPGTRDPEPGTRNPEPGIDPRPVLRRFRPPVAVRVVIERGSPVHVAVDRRGMPGGRVEQCAGPWRTSGAWWDADGAHWDRDEWDLALADGAIVRLFRDRVAGRWFLEGVVD